MKFTDIELLNPCQASSSAAAVPEPDNEAEDAAADGLTDDEEAQALREYEEIKTKWDNLWLGFKFLCYYFEIILK